MCRAVQEIQRLNPPPGLRIVSVSFPLQGSAGSGQKLGELLARDPL
jgi:hypothetical protein